MTDTKGQQASVDGARSGAASSIRAAGRVSWAIIGRVFVVGLLVVAFSSPLAVLLATTFGEVVGGLIGLIGLILAATFIAVAFEAVKLASRPGDARHRSVADQDNKPLPDGATS